MLLFILVLFLIDQFCILEVSSRNLFNNVEEERNTTRQTKALSDNKKHTPKNPDLYETGYELSKDPSKFVNETLFESEDYDLAETGGCTCNCGGTCTPKGCNGARGSSMSRSLAGFHYLDLNTQGSLIYSFTTRKFKSIYTIFFQQ